ncbi:hypothetical protein ZOSMA_37G00370 [Zostera marina]|uniref:Uncharacterized protein n=1 Tax=Zostera marina TaxID=29655 RepID=A0A0K9P7G3_ZOSMR|nr:hypothetical protein ZOSMA_37G00370 [Zostera marina]
MPATTVDRSSRPSSSSSGTSFELDPLLKDLSDKRQFFKKNVQSLAADLKDARARLATKEESFSRENQTRKAAEAKVKDMEKQICQLQIMLDEKDVQLQVSTISANQYMKEFGNLRSELSITQAAADASAELARSAQAQCSSLMKELAEKNILLKEHENRVNKLEEQLDLMRNDLHAREVLQRELKDEVIKIEREIALAISNADKVCPTDGKELVKYQEDVLLMNFDTSNRHLSTKDEEIAKLRDEIRFLSTYWKHKTKELQVQTSKHQRTDQELKKCVLKLEFCLQEVKSQTRKLQRMGKRRDEALKELQYKWEIEQQKKQSNEENQKIWERSGFKLLASMSMVFLVIFARR